SGRGPQGCQGRCRRLFQEVADVAARDQQGLDLRLQVRIAAALVLHKAATLLGRVDFRGADKDVICLGGPFRPTASPNQGQRVPLLPLKRNGRVRTWVLQERCVFFVLKETGTVPVVKEGEHRRFLSRGPGRNRQAGYRVKVKNPLSVSPAAAWRPRPARGSID